MRAHGKDILHAVKPLALNDHLNERIKEQVYGYSRILFAFVKSRYLVFKMLKFQRVI